MPESPGTSERSRAIAAGVLVSVLLHAAGVTALAFGPATARRADRAETALVLPVQAPMIVPIVPPPGPPEPELRPGIDDSTHKTPNWQGFADATPHAAPKSTVEQAALSPAPGAEASTPSTPAKESPRTPEVPASPTAAEPAPAPERPATEPTPDAAQQPHARSAQPVSEHEPSLALTPGDDPPNPVQLIQLLKAVLAVPIGGPAPMPPTPAPRPAPPIPPTTHPAASAPSSPGATPGERSESESEAASLDDAIDFTFGKPLAGKGLKVTTVRPNWSITTRLTAWPRNPVVRVRFARDGRVLNAAFIKGQSTGYPDVDEPLLNAIRRWRASGKELARIPADDPRAGVTMTFRIMLRD